MAPFAKPVSQMLSPDRYSTSPAETRTPFTATTCLPSKYTLTPLASICAPNLPSGEVSESVAKMVLANIMLIMTAFSFFCKSSGNS